MKVTLISTVYNEEKTIEEFFQSLLNQGKLPEEIVIVDGGSVDKTVEKIEKFRPKLKPSCLIVIKKAGLNRSQGRNLAIEKATSEIIVASDAGCIFKKGWFSEITKPFNNKMVEVVAGFYLPTGKSLLQKLAGELTSVPIKKVDSQKFLPSSRSIAFRKSAWKEVGGYPESLNYCEDLVFDLRLKKAKKCFVFAPEAIVYWPQKNNPWSLIKQFFNYAIGDGLAGKESPHFLKLWLKNYLFCLTVILILLNPWFVLPILFGLFFYFLLKSIFLSFKINNLLVVPIALFVLPILNLTVVFGYILGSFKLYGQRN